MSQFTPLVSKMSGLVDRLTEKPPEDKRQQKWSEAFAEELQVVNQRRGKEKLDDDKNLVGIAFSGGGIRSATFGLGVLEGLKKYNLLSQILRPFASRALTYQYVHGKAFVFPQHLHNDQNVHVCRECI